MNSHAVWKIDYSKVVVLGLAIMSAALGGCGRGVSGDRPPSVQPGMTRAAIAGPLGGEIESVVTNEWADPCDTSQAVIMREVGRALDERAAQIQQASHSVDLPKYYKRVQVAPTYMLEPGVPRKIRPGWTTEKESWIEVYQEYLKIKDQPINTHWVDLDRNVRFLLSDDESRVINGEDMYLDKDSGAPLESVATKVKACADNASCTSLGFSRSDEAFVSANPIWNWYLKQLAKAPETDRRRSLISRLNDWLQSDLNRYGFSPNKTVEHPNEREFILPLDAGPFAESEALLSGYIEQIWKRGEIHLKIRWGDSVSKPDIFRILLGGEEGGRSFVSTSKQSVQLFPEVRTRSVAHEIGHVLGFMDHYYTVWKPDSCEYVIQSRDDDLMAEPDTGEVTPDEWSELEKQYPVKASS